MASESNLEMQIDELKKLEYCSVKVLENIGEFALMIIIKNKSPEFAIRFHFADDTLRAPTIIILCKGLSSEVISKLQKVIVENITFDDPSFLVNTFSNAKSQIETLIESSTSSKNQKNSHFKRKKSNKKSSNDVKEKSVDEKKASMKTAMDVVNRILWDDSVPKDQMVIGYLDRFIGVVEKPFYAFSWEDISSVDYYTFAIPKHRIMYFKYRKVKVWDKESRLDNVFGSTGSNKTIVDVISSYRDEDYINSEDITVIQPNPQPSITAMNDSEDDDVELVVGPGSAPPPASRTSSIILTEDEDDDDDERAKMVEQLSESKTYWRDKLRPNFFICFQVTNREIQATASHIQDIICEREPLYEECCTPEQLLHVTLCTLRLDTAEQVSQCVEIIRSAEDELRELLPKKPLPIRGLDRFFGRVLYARVIANQDFYDFVQHIETLLRANGMPLSDSHEFVPHMSLVKVNRPVTRKLGSKNINPLIYYGSENVDFGEQCIESIYLCSMEKTRGEDGFYISPGSCTFKRNIL